MTAPPRPGRNIWIDAGDGFIGAAWFWPPADARSTVVVIVPGIAHEERTMCGGLVALAESLAEAGLPALLIDLHGCSQSAGLLEDVDIADRWRNGIREAVRHARGTGAARVIVIGVRLGVPLAIEALADEPLAALIAWAPVVNGKRHVRELKMLQRASEIDTAAAGGIAIGGFSIPATVLDHIASLNLETIEKLETPYAMLRETPEGLSAPWLARLGERGVVVQEQISTQIYPWLFSASDQPALPYEDIEALTRWSMTVHAELAAGEPTAAPREPTPRPAIEFIHRGHRVRETFVEFGPSRLAGVFSEPVDGASFRPVCLLMSTVGPGRTFADFARDEASRGRCSLRFDFAGFGTSGRGDSNQGGELYTDNGSRDVQAAMDHLRQAGHRDIYGLGFCAGAWSMIQADVASELRAAVAINVALYRQPGPATPELVKRTRQRLARISPGLVRLPLLRALGAQIRRIRARRRAPVEWLIRLCRTDVRVLLAYADRDPGLEYLSKQISRGLRKQVRRPFVLQTYPGLGHLAEGPSARARLFKDIEKFFADLDRQRKRSDDERTGKSQSPQKT